VINGYNGRFFELSNKKATQNLHTKVEWSRKSTKKDRKIHFMHRITPEKRPNVPNFISFSSEFVLKRSEKLLFYYLKSAFKAV